jgi:hypothetical protein
MIILIHELDSKFDADSKRLMDEHNELITRETSIAQRISLVTRVSIMFQILGLIMVLAKDLGQRTIS